MVRLLALGLVLVGCAGQLRAQNGLGPAAGQNDAGAQPQDQGMPLIQDNDNSPYHRALLAYKAGNYEEAEQAFAGTSPAKLDDNAAILDSRILIELKRYDQAEKVLRARPGSKNTVVMETALGDVLLAGHSFSRAARYYAAALQAKPNDPDLILKSVYAGVGAGDMVGAGQLASQLAPLDPKNPYDDHASYYFAQAALAESAGKTQEAQDQIQIARTNYGVTVTDRYLKTYLKVFSPPGSPEPAPGQKPPAPSGVK